MNYERAKEILFTIGITANNLGFIYFLDGIEYFLNNESNPNYKNLQLYPYIANKNNTSVNAVERALRLSLKNADANKKLTKLNNLLKVEAIKENCIPPNAEMIELISSLLH